jgi:hypothetical protein
LILISTLQDLLAFEALYLCVGVARHLFALALS